MKTIYAFALAMLSLLLATGAIAQPYQPALVKDVCPTGASSPSIFYKVGNKALSIMTDCVNGREWWVTDGSLAGTQMLMDIFPGTRGQTAVMASACAVFDNKLYFLADDSVHGVELWMTDGTTAGTQMIKDISPGPARSYILDIWEANGRVYFNKSKGSGLPTANEIWTTDGTAAGTVLFKDINHVVSRIAHNGKMYLSIIGPQGEEPWISDGTDTGTKLLKDINPGTAGSSPRLFTVLNGIVYFSAQKNNYHQIWRTDGTDTGTWQVTNLANAYLSGLTPLSMIAHNNRLYFNGYDSATYAGLFTSDGTGAGTKKICKLPDLSTGAFGILEDKVFFTSNHLGGGNELCYADANDTVRRIADIRPGSSGSSPGYYNVFNNKLFFTASPASNRRHLYYTDGTDTGTHQVILPAGYNGTTVTSACMIAFDSLFVFAGQYSDTLGVELYKLTGYTHAGPTSVSQTTKARGTLVVYPNPATHQLKIILPADLKQQTLMSVYDVAGKIILQQSIVPSKEAELNVSNLPSGMYYLRLQRYTASFLKQ